MESEEVKESLIANIQYSGARFGDIIRRMCDGCG
jgi:hypothetical protein